MRGRFRVTGVETRCRRSDGVEVTAEEWEIARDKTMWPGAVVGAEVAIVPKPQHDGWEGSVGWRVGDMIISMGVARRRGSTLIGCWEKGGAELRFGGYRGEARVEVEVEVSREGRIRMWMMWRMEDEFKVTWMDETTMVGERLG